jgi:hypothetical protein
LDPDLLSKEGMEGGLTLLIDSNRERTVEAQVSRVPSMMDTDHLSMNRRITSTQGSAEIYIPTLSPYTGFQPGTYKMNSLKRMTGTASFLKMPDVTKKCQNEPLNDCRTREALARGQEACGCLPWPLTSIISNEVIAVAKGNSSFITGVFTNGISGYMATMYRQHCANGICLFVKIRFKDL